MSFKSPIDVAMAFLKQAYGSSPIQRNFEVGSGSVDPAPAGPRISEEALTFLIQTMFFVSVAAEEGHINPLGIVIAKDLTEFQSQTDSAWEVVGFSPGKPFDVEHVAKLASACAWPRSFLAVIRGRDDADFSIAGIVTPHSRHFLSRDGLIRVLAPKPGVVEVCQGESVVVRYERGALHVKMSPPARNRHRPELDSIQQAVFGEHAMQRPIDVRDYILSIVEAMAELGKGGLLAILGPSEDPNQHFIRKSKQINPPLGLGSAISEMVDTQAFVDYKYQNFIRAEDGKYVEVPPTIEQMCDQDIARSAEARASRLMEQVTRLTTVDGAVIMSQRLDVLAFGAKLEVPEGFSAEIETAAEDLKFEPWSLEARGTRHRAAAAFVAQVPGRLAVIVSQDGEAAMFGRLNGKEKLLRWPIWAVSKQ